MKYLIACLGNPLMGDDGVGLAVAYELTKQGYNVIVCGSDLSPVLAKVDDVDLLVVIDAVDWGSEPGSVSVFKLDEIDEAHVQSSHSIGVTKMLKIIMKIFKKPENVYLVGIQPERVEPITELTPKVKLAINEALIKVEELIKKIEKKIED